MDRGQTQLTVPLSTKLINALDDLVAMSDGMLDREHAAAMAVEHGVEKLLRDAGHRVSRSLANCPRCSGPLFVGESAGALLQGCAYCGGVWLDNASARLLLAGVNYEAIVLAKQAQRNAKKKVDASPNVDCPVCSEAMERKEMPNVATVDLCTRHGTWFDTGELVKLLEMKQKRAQLDAFLHKAELELRITWGRLDAEYNNR
jgi:Zn-finger nucleic acid-binding protein